MKEDVAVEICVDSAGKNYAVVTDRHRGRAWSGEGDTPNAATTDAVRKFLGDRHAREYVER